MVNSGQIGPKVKTDNSLKYFKAIDFFLVGSKTNWTSKLICFYIKKKKKKKSLKSHIWFQTKKWRCYWLVDSISGQWSKQISLRTSSWRKGWCPTTRGPRSSKQLNFATNRSKAQPVCSKDKRFIANSQSSVSKGVENMANSRSNIYERSSMLRALLRMGRVSLEIIRYLKKFLTRFLF